MTSDEFRSMMRHAVWVSDIMDDTADAMASLLQHRLRRVSDVDALRTLKRELRKFDMTTGKWKD